MTESISGYLGIACAKEINPSLLNLASGKFLGHGQKAATFFNQNIMGLGSSTVANIVAF